MTRAIEILCSRLGYDSRDQLDQAILTGSRHVDWILEALQEYAEECRKKPVHIVVDKEALSYKDIIMGVYDWDGDAESCRMMYASTVIGSPTRFTVLEEELL